MQSQPMCVRESVTARLRAFQPRRSSFPVLLLSCSLSLLLASSPALAQVPAVGTPEMLEVATWNVEWFGSPSNGPSDDARQRQHVAEVIRSSEIDLWGLQEISNQAAFDALLHDLGDGFKGFRAASGNSQSLAYVWRTDVIESRSIREVLTEFDFATRPPYQLEATVTLPDTTLVVTFIAVHMKAFDDVQSYERRVEGARRLKNYLDFTTLSSAPVVVLGDFNDELTGSITPGRPSPYANFLSDPADYAFLTLPLDERGTGTWCGNSTACSGSSTIDHLLLTDELFGAYVDGSAARFDDLLDAFDGTGGACGGEFVCTTSDHLPIYARFAFRSGTAVAGADVPASLHLLDAFPNPATDHLTLRFEAAGGPVRIALFDLLGRTVYQHDVPMAGPGLRTLHLPLGTLPSGPYLLRLSTDSAAAARLVVRH